jgi:hypothetical protein
MNKLGKRFWMLLGAFVVCAGMIAVVSACGDDEECKKCENKDSDIPAATFCGEALKDAQRSDSDWKNCK